MSISPLCSFVNFQNLFKGVFKIRLCQYLLNDRSSIIRKFLNVVSICRGETAAAIISLLRSMADLISQHNDLVFRELMKDRGDGDGICSERFTETYEAPPGKEVFLRSGMLGFRKLQVALIARKLILKR